MIDIIDVAVSTSSGPAAAGNQHPSGTPASTDSESDDGRWREWRRKGRDQDARFRRRVRTVVIDVAGVVALVGALWIAAVTWL